LDLGKRLITGRICWIFPISQKSYEKTLIFIGKSEKIPQKVTKNQYFSDFSEKSLDFELNFPNRPFSDL